MTHQQTESFQLDQVVSWLESQNYRITRPFTPRDSYCDAPPPPKLQKAAILDIETTGVKLALDQIIELGIVVFEYSPETGQVYRVLETYSALEDPEIPIPDESTKIHGITDDMVKGEKIFDSYVDNLLSDVSLVIAHNASFDRGFIESRLPFFQSKAWACSFTQIPWKTYGFNSLALEFLAYKSGFHFSGHRASTDCHALLEVLQTDFPSSGLKPLKILADKSLTIDLKLRALRTPFESKDSLKERGYRWDVERKTWHTHLSKDAVDAETKWLRENVYDNSVFSIEYETIDGYNRFSSRTGPLETMQY